MAPNPEIIVTRRFNAPPVGVFDAWLDAESIPQFLFATPGGKMEKVEINPRVGGGFVIAERRGEVLETHFGTYLEIDRPRRLAFSFGVDPNAPSTQVAIEIASSGDGAELNLKHEGVWPDYAERTRAGWTMILQELARTLGETA